MAVTKLLNLIALSSIAILACSYGATPVNALTVDHHARSAGHAHLAIAMKKRGKRCRPRPTSSVVKPPATPTPVPTSPDATSQAPAPTPTKGGSNPPPPPPPPPPSNGRGKVGLGWPQDDDRALANFVKGSSVVGMYAWNPWLPSAADKLGIEKYPMLWSEKQIGDFKKFVVKGYAKHVLAFNEPNQQGQANMDPGRGANVWKQYIQPLKQQGYTLVSPACTNAPSGKTWIRDFLAACNGCTVDAIALHFYGTDPQKFIDYVTDFYNTFKRPIWVTEYACQNFGDGKQCSKDDVWNFMSKTKAWMDSTPFVARYFYFGAMYNMGNVNVLNQLMSSNGSPNDLGRFYIH
jgi:hypothetical protein